MKVMVLVKASKETEAGVLPTQQELTDMMSFNEALVKSGVMLAGDGLQPSVKGARIHYQASKRTVIDGPFTEAKELIAGYWIWEVKSLDEAIEWAKRIPFHEGEIEIRQMFSPDDFAPSDPTGEVRASAERLRNQSGT